MHPKNAKMPLKSLPCSSGRTACSSESLSSGRLQLVTMNGIPFRNQTMPSRRVSWLPLRSTATSSGFKYD